MKRKKFYILITLLITVIIFSVAAICNQCGIVTPATTTTTEKVGVEVSKETTAEETTAETTAKTEETTTEETVTEEAATEETPAEATTEEATVPFAVTSVTVSVDTPSFTGPCPHTFNFSAVITVNGPGTVTYRWERSGGLIAPAERITFAAAGTQTVTSSRSHCCSGGFWDIVRILTPNDVVSNKANFTLTCPFGVTSVTASVDTPSFTGGCPRTFNFSAVIRVDGPVTVTYSWEGSDGTVAPAESITFAAAGTQTVTTSWSLGASVTGWQRVRILTPNNTRSNKADFTLTCVPFAVTSVTASVDPPSFTGPCPHTFNFSAVITVNGPGTVTYCWAGSDGSVTADESITFAAAGTQTVTTSWSLGASGNRWQQVVIFRPNNTRSNRANFTLTCTR